MDKYLDSILEQNSTWWQKDLDASITFEDLDDDNLTNYQEWLLGSNPVELDTDLDGLTDSLEFSFNSNPTKIDTDSDGLNDVEEWSEDSSKRTNPRDPDTDGDGLFDGEDMAATDPKNIGVISGRISVSNKYSKFSTVYYRFADTNSTDSKYKDWNSSHDWLSEKNDTWLGGPYFFYEKGLTYDRNYSIQVYLDLNTTVGSSHNYDLGEPFFEENITLESDKIGLILKPVDLPPKYYLTKMKMI